MRPAIQIANKKKTAREHVDESFDVGQGRAVRPFEEAAQRSVRVLGNVDIG